jgi:hypothetical protein
VRAFNECRRKEKLEQKGKGGNENRPQQEDEEENWDVYAPALRPTEDSKGYYTASWGSWKVDLHCYIQLGMPTTIVTNRIRRPNGTS